jgi:hypothetical protein
MNGKAESIANLADHASTRSARTAWVASKLYGLRLLFDFV